MSKKRAHVTIKGRVQGVFFRTTAEEKASSLGISGWITNRRDGTVEGLFEGEEEAVDEMVSWCYEGSGPADVRDVDVKEEEYTGELNGFSVR
ncbi:MAG: acylphosphatase [Candidatus Omnitrophica bacterium]|nr:acylphosphatase [Candidatus Omnitrophota bacterium]